ncbi:hypothetical protein CIPAW_02G187000 [Carya illinoinensis]|uniref:Uncharacterized protein n=1 Tax=Carya illinoinensis TaxID=32201 RepID=A0A8T1RFN0_CARIL|nr:hypothetical protein CIPAW_02G187000 [Carya illinoinensis]
MCLSHRAGCVIAPSTKATSVDKDKTISEEWGHLHDFLLTFILFYVFFFFSSQSSSRSRWICWMRWRVSASRRDPLVRYVERGCFAWAQKTETEIPFQSATIWCIVVTSCEYMVS